MSRLVRNRWSACLVAGALVLGACADDDEATPATTVDASATHPELGATSLKVMTFNVWLGGGLVASTKVVLAFAYIETAVDGSYEFTADDFGDELPAGDYVAILASDDHYIVLASAAFTVG